MTLLWHCQRIKGRGKVLAYSHFKKLLFSYAGFGAGEKSFDLPLMDPALEAYMLQKDEDSDEVKYTCQGSQQAKNGFRFFEE